MLCCLKCIEKMKQSLSSNVQGWGNLPDRIRGAVTSARVREIMGLVTSDDVNPPLLSSFGGLSWHLLSLGPFQVLSLGAFFGIWMTSVPLQFHILGAFLGICLASFLINFNIILPHPSTCCRILWFGTRLYFLLLWAFFYLSRLLMVVG